MWTELSGSRVVFHLYHYGVEEMADLVDTFILGRGGAVRGAAQRPWERRGMGARQGTPTRAAATGAPVGGARRPPRGRTAYGCDSPVAQRRAEQDDDFRPRAHYEPIPRHPRRRGW